MIKLLPLLRMNASRALLVLLLACSTPVAMAASSADSPGIVKTMISDAGVQVKSWLDPNENIAVSQQVKLYIEVSVNGWFSSGTRFGAWSVDNAIALRAEQFAVNSTRREAGETWAVQLWTMIIYPQQAGVYELPSIPLTLTVTRPDDQGTPITATGTVDSPSVSFSTMTPRAMKNKSQWLATTRFEVKETYDKSSDDLKPGDALQRTVRFEADNVAAMMLPEPVFETVQGISMYPKPSKIEDTINRGEYLAERSESVTYVVETEGEYRLPPLTFYWWDLGAQQIQSVTLPGRVISTKGAGTPREGDVASGSGGRAWSRQSVVALVVFVVVLLVGFVVLRRSLLPLIERRKKQIKNAISLDTIQAQYESACRQRKYVEATLLLYRWLEHPAQSDLIEKFKMRAGREGAVRDCLSSLGEASLCSQFDDLMAATYGPPDNVNESFESLLQGLARLLRHSDTKQHWSKPVELRLN